MQPTGIGAITLFVTDLARARGFYARTFDADPLFEDAESVAFRFGATVVNLLVESAAPELVEPAGVAAAGGGTRFVLTLGVEDVDASCRDLAARDVTLLNGPVNRPWGVRTAAFRDPDGYVWEVAQELA